MRAALVAAAAAILYTSNAQAPAPYRTPLAAIVAAAVSVSTNAAANIHKALTP